MRIQRELRSPSPEDRLRRHEEVKQRREHLQQQVDFQATLKDFHITTATAATAMEEFSALKVSPRARASGRVLQWLQLWSMITALRFLAGQVFKIRSTKAKNLKL